MGRAVSTSPAGEGAEASAAGEDGRGAGSAAPAAALSPVARFAMSCPAGPVDGHSLPEVVPAAVAPPSPAAAAAFSPCGRYRWWLQRCWEPGRPPLLFVGLNPSRADGRCDDPTLRRLLGYARAWGFGSLEVLNLFALVAPRPALLRRALDPVGACNDAWIRRRLRLRPEAAVWIGWGNQGRWRGRDREVLALIACGGRSPLALATTAAGMPRHPLYCPASLTLRGYGAS